MIEKNSKLYCNYKAEIIYNYHKDIAFSSFIISFRSILFIIFKNVFCVKEVIKENTIMNVPDLDWISNILKITLDNELISNSQLVIS